MSETACETIRVGRLVFPITFMGKYNDRMTLGQGHTFVPAICVVVFFGQKTPFHKMFY